MLSISCLTAKSAVAFGASYPVQKLCPESLKKIALSKILTESNQNHSSSLDECQNMI